MKTTASPLTLLQMQLWVIENMAMADGYDAFMGRLYPLIQDMDADQVHEVLVLVAQLVDAVNAKAKEEHPK